MPEPAAIEHDANELRTAAIELQRAEHHLELAAEALGRTHRGGWTVGAEGLVRQSARLRGKLVAGAEEQGGVL